MSPATTGYFIYLVKPWAPDAVVFNAVFGYNLRYDAYISSTGRLIWCPLPRLYPPEASYTFGSVSSVES